MRLQKFLSRAGVASRRKSEELILQGRVRVNGDIVTELGTKVDPDRDEVQFDGETVNREATRWIAIHKPTDALTTRDDPGGRRTVYDLLPPAASTLAYVGRLDRHTEGLLLLSNAGDAVHRLMHPSWEVERVYEVETTTPLPRAEREALVEGVQLEDGPAMAVRVDPIDREGNWIRLVLLEGRNREVRRMMKVLGRPVVRLRRVRYGPVALGSLPFGEWRDLTPDEVQAIHHTVGLEPPDTSGEDDS